jgi:transposase
MARTKSHVNQSDEARAENRRRALEMRTLSGSTAASIARFIGVNKATVTRWFATADTQGEDYVTAALPVGRRRILSAEQVRQLVKLLKRPPSKYAIVLKHDQWTWDGITALASETFEADFVRQTVQRALRAAGWDLA